MSGSGEVDDRTCGEAGSDAVVKWGVEKCGAARWLLVGLFALGRGHGNLAAIPRAAESLWGGAWAVDFDTLLLRLGGA